MFGIRRIMLSSLIIGASLVFLGGAAIAGDGKVELKISVIHATKDGKQVDPALKKIQGSLQKAFGGFTSFKQVAKQAAQIIIDGDVEIKLPNGQKATVTYSGKEKNRHKLKLAIVDSKVAVDLRVPARKMFWSLPGWVSRSGLSPAGWWTTFYMMPGPRWPRLALVRRRSSWGISTAHGKRSPLPPVWQPRPSVWK